MMKKKKYKHFIKNDKENIFLIYLNWMSAFMHLSVVLVIRLSLVIRLLIINVTAQI